MSGHSSPTAGPLEPDPRPSLVGSAASPGLPAAPSVEIAILDRTGTITAVNRPWDAFRRLNGGDATRCGVGMSYPAVCDRAADGISTAVAAAIRAACEGSLGAPRTFLVPCANRGPAGWYDLSVASRHDDSDEAIGATVALWPVAPPRSTSATGTGEMDSRSIWELLEASPDGIVVTDPDGLITYVNRQLEAISGYRREALLGRPVEMMVPDERRDGHHRLRQGYRRSPSIRMMGAGPDLRLRTVSGSTVPVEISLAPVQVGTASMTAASVRDVSTQRAADRSRQQLLRLLDLVPDAVYIVDATTAQIDYANSGAALLVGHSREDLTAMTLYQLSPSASDAGRLALLDEHRQRGPGHEHVIEVLRRARDGSDIPCDSHGQLVETDSGHEKFIIIDRDARDRLAHEAADRRQRQLIDLVASLTTMTLTDAPSAQVYRHLAEGITALLDAASGAVVLHDDLAGRFVTVGAVGPAATRPFNDHVSLDYETMRTWTASPVVVTLTEATTGQAGSVGYPVGPGLVAPFAGPQPAKGVLAVFRDRRGAPFSPEDVALLGEVARQAGVVIELGRARADSQRAAVLGDRQRIARDLHDTVIQDLIGVGMQLAAAAPSLAPALRRSLEPLIDELDDTVRKLRTVVFDTSAPPSAETVTMSVRRLVDQAARVLGHQPTLVVAGDADRLPPLLTEHLFATVREGLSNVARHAGATCTTVTVTVDDDLVSLVIDDDGRGPGTVSRAGTGLINLQDRARSLGGRAAVTPRPGGGTRLHWTASNRRSPGTPGPEGGG